MKANWHGIEWVKSQPELVEKVKQWMILSTRIMGEPEKELFYYKSYCPMTGKPSPPIDSPSETKCIICKKIWPDIITDDYGCPCFHPDIDPREVVEVAVLIIRNICNGNGSATAGLDT